MCVSVCVLSLDIGDYKISLFRKAFNRWNGMLKGQNYKDFKANIFINDSAILTA